MTPVAVSMGTGSLYGTPLLRTFTRGEKQYELGNHLGNVLAIITDRKNAVSSAGNSSLIDHFDADIASAQDYYPFGMQMPGRTHSSGSYRYGFNGKENDNEVKGVGNEIDYGMRVYDPRVARFLSLDPITKKYAELTPYQYASNSPITFIDQDGLEFVFKMPDGRLYFQPPSDHNRIPIPTGAIPIPVNMGGFSHNRLFDGITNNIVILLTPPLEGINTFVGGRNVRRKTTFEIQNGKGKLVTNTTFEKGTPGDYIEAGINVFNFATLFNGEREGGGSGMHGEPTPGFHGETGPGAPKLNIPAIAETNLLAGKAQATANGGEGVAVNYEGAEVPIYRGGENFDLKSGEYRATPNGKYPARGLSLDVNPVNLQKFGGANKIISIPEELQIIPTPSTINPGHFDIIPKDTKMSAENFQKLLNEIKTIPVKK
ncbi:RHS repeat domain-containing protein [Flavitalea flava]